MNESFKELYFSVRLDSCSGASQQLPQVYK